MKSRKFPLIALAGVVGVCALTAMAINRNNANRAAHPVEQRFEVRGQIRGLEPDGRTLRIAHEEIPNYMEAMTMALSVRDAALLNGLQVGDEIGFQLIVTEEDSWIGRITKLGAGTVPGDTAIDLSKAVSRVQVGEAVPDFSLLD